MLEKLMKLYTTAMAYDVRSPMPHLVGPPGSGKSTAARLLAEMMGVNLHILNVSRLSPLETEGVQMPINENTMLHMIPSAVWTSLRPGDILMLEEFLRGFPEVYNGLLDIFTERRVGAFHLPPVFIMGASNTVTTYDPALEDRLLHLPVSDPRKSKLERERLAKLIVETVGLLPEMVSSPEMSTLMADEVQPMFKVLDSFKGNKSSAPSLMEGHSVRNLIGQAQLREVQSDALKDLISMNNHKAIVSGKHQYVYLLTGAGADQRYESKCRDLVGNPRLTPLQAKNLDLNIQLLDLEQARRENGTPTDDDADPDDLFSV